MQENLSIRQRASGVNIPTGERVASVALGTAAVAFGLRQRAALRWLLVATGATLVARGALGTSPIYRRAATDGGVLVRRAITVRASREALYAFWRRLDNLPRFMEHVKSVTSESDLRSHWVVEEGPLTLTWTTDIVTDIEGRRIAWTSLPGSQVMNEGTVEFRDAPGLRGTEVHVTIRYEPIAGAPLAAPLRALLQRFTAHQLDVELTRFRQLMELGEITTAASRTDQLTEVERNANPAQLPGVTLPSGAWSTATAGG